MNIAKRSLAHGSKKRRYPALADMKAKWQRKERWGSALLSPDCPRHTLAPVHSLAGAEQ
jgi:hypothetical protein